MNKILLNKILNKNQIQNKIIFKFSTFNDTIFALSTAPMKSAISIIRVNGENATQSLKLVKPQKFNENKIYNNNEILDITKIKPRVINLKKIFDFSRQNNIIDQPLILYSPKPNSYTGEDMVEFHIHGSKAVQIKLLQELAKIEGFRLAEPGEFTQRALLNNKLNLYEIEALHDLINSETESQRKMAANQFLGNNKEIFDSWREKLCKCLAHVEAYIDFEEHESDVQSDVVEKMLPSVNQICQEMQTALDYQNIGELIKEGIKITLLGNPNVGKSSLLNLLSKRDVSIISEIPGTTRDILQTQINISGNSVIFYDTAGLRETQNQIEQEGIKRALKQANQSQLIINLYDIQNYDIEIQEKNQKIILNKKIENNVEKNNNQQLNLNKNNIKSINIINKYDSLPQKLQNYITQFQNQIFLNNYDNYQKLQKVDCLISCANKQNIDQLIELINQHIKQILMDDKKQQEIQSEQIILINERQKQEIQKCLNCIQTFLENDQLDIIYRAQDLKQALNYLGNIQGKVDNEEILDILFKDFCIGK